MKRTFKYFFILFAIALIASCTDSAKNNNTYFGGKIINPKSEYVLLYNQDELIDSLALDENDKFIGEYKNSTHNITINIEEIKDRLVVKRVFNNNFTLNTYSNNSFYAEGFGKLDFTFIKNREVSGFKLSGMNFKNISFSKQ